MRRQEANELEDFQLDEQFNRQKEDNEFLLAEFQAKNIRVRPQSGLTNTEKDDVRTDSFGRIGSGNQIYDQNEDEDGKH